MNWSTFKANINLVFIVVVKPPKSLTKPMVFGVFLTQKGLHQKLTYFLSLLGKLEFCDPYNNQHGLNSSFW